MGAYRPCPPMCCSGSCGSSKSGSGVSDPSSPRWCMVARRERISSVVVKAVSFMPSGSKMRSANSSPSRLPLTPSTTLPTQSMFLPYSQRSPGSNRSTERNDAMVPVTTLGTSLFILAVAQEVLVEEVVAEARSMEHKLVYRDVGVRRTLPRFTVRVETFEDLDISNL